MLSKLIAPLFLLNREVNYWEELTAGLLSQIWTMRGNGRILKNRLTFRGFRTSWVGFSGR
jgi:hypothetical protein